MLETEPDLLAFGVASSMYRWAVDLAHAVRAECSVPIVFGGLHPTLEPEHTLGNSCVDHVILGEGEYPLLDLVNHLDDPDAVTRIPNLWTKKNGEIVQNDLRPLDYSLDDIPFPDKEIYRHVAPYFRSGYTATSGRGCHDRCSFCFHNYYHKLYAGKGPWLRRRSEENVIRELAEARRKFGPRYVRWYDGTFLYDPQWLRTFSRPYRRDVGLPFWCVGNPDHLTEEVASLLKDMGCYEVQIGFQTFSEATRCQYLLRNETNKDLEMAIRNTRRFGLSASLDIMLEIPGQRPEEVADMIHFLNRNRVDRLNVYWSTYYPRMDIVEFALQEGKLSPHEAQELRVNPPVYANHLGRHNKEKWAKRYGRMLIYLLFLPPSWVDWLMRTGVYRYLPGFTVFVLMSLSYSQRIQRKYNLMMKRIFQRYVLFGFRKIVGRYIPPPP